MTGRERIFALLDGKPVDSLPFMPITMMFACDRIGAQYRDYATDFQVLVEGQTQTAAEFDFDYVNIMSDPACEAADCGAPVKYFPNQPPALDEANALLADKGAARVEGAGPPHQPAHGQPLAGAGASTGSVHTRKS